MASQIVYIVQQINWEYNDEFFYRNGDQPTKAFTTVQAAEAHRQKLEADHRQELMETPPIDQIHNWSNNWSANIVYTFGSLEAITSLSRDVFCAKIQALGLPDFPVKENYLGQQITEYWNPDWWTNAWNMLKPDRTTLLWDLFDRLHFYEVVEIEVH